jgi:6-phosphogluconolactonase
MTPIRGTLRVFQDAEALAQGAASWLTERAAATAGRFMVALSGGSTPKHLYSLLAGAPYAGRFPWARTQFVFGDERFVPPNDPASNARMAREALLAHVPVPPGNVHVVPTVGVPAEEAARRYEAVLQGLYGASTLDPARPLLDVTLLGLGDDGHTASLIPGEPVLDERLRWTGVVAHGRPETRITLTYPALESSAAVLFLVQGEGKRAVLDRVLSGDTDIPAGRLRPQGELVWFVDRAAAGRWAR